MSTGRCACSGAHADSCTIQNNSPEDARHGLRRWHLLRRIVRGHLRLRSISLKERPTCKHSGFARSKQSRHHGLNVVRLLRWLVHREVRLQVEKHHKQQDAMPELIAFPLLPCPLQGSPSCPKDSPVPNLRHHAHVCWQHGGS